MSQFGFFVIRGYRWYHSNAMVNVHRVEAVLLQDGKWYDVQRAEEGKSSFEVDEYVFIEPHSANSDDGKVLFGGTSRDRGTIPATGATWKGEGGKTYSCPLSSIVAVRMVPLKKSA